MLISNFALYRNIAFGFAIGAASLFATTGNILLP